MSRLLCHLMLCLLIFSSTAPPAGAGEDSRRTLSMPLAESEKIISRWMGECGRQTSRVQPGPSHVRLTATGGGAGDWQIDLESRSALFTDVLVQHSPDHPPERCSEQHLWSFLDKYTKSGLSEVTGPAETIPKAVAAHRPAVVCITGDENTGHIQLTGFLIDETGLVISTAHDIKGSISLTVNFPNGKKISGHITKIDHQKDLALTKIDLRPESIVSLKRARPLPRMGEKIYAIGYPLGSSGTIVSGVVTGPLRLAEGMLLCQVNLDTQPGSSGSPVFDEEGALVAVVKGRYRGTETVGFIIPVDTVLEFLGR